MKSLVVKSSSKLKKNQEKNFVITSLILNNISFLQSDYMYLLYMENIQSYEIIISNEKIELFDILLLNNKVLEGYTLFIIDDIFLIFNDKKPYFLQKYEEQISDIELGEYVKNRFKIELNSITSFYTEEFKTLKNINNFKKNSSVLNNINEKKYFQLKFFLFYLCLILIIFYLAISHKIEKNEENVVKRTPVKIDNNFNSFYERFEKLRFELHSNGLELKELLFEGKNLNIIFYGEKKNNIYEFLKKYNTKIDNQHIIYHKELKLYESSADVKRF